MRHNATLNLRKLVAHLREQRAEYDRLDLYENEPQLRF
jgi:hypothetical protein